jgi:L-threonylcarbamoyladenylate synthase
MAVILPFNFPPSPKITEQALACVQSGGVLAVPTDSFYALAVGIFQPAALEQLLAIKGDRAHKPFPVLIGDPSQLDQLVDEVPEVANKLMKQFWPGLLTLVLNAQANLSPGLTSEQGAVGVRQPNYNQLCNLLIRTGPLTGTSANRTGQAPAVTAEDVQRDLGTNIDLILDGGQTSGGQPSTIFQIQPEIRIIRQGAISLSAIYKVLKPDIAST